MLKVMLAVAVVAALPAPAQALPAGGMKSVEATRWGYLYAGSTTGSPTPATPPANAGTLKATFKVNYSINFPTSARAAFDKAVEIWSTNFNSTVPIVIDATWTRLGPGVLGSARPTRFFSNFDNAPSRDLWYTSSMANSIAGRDLDVAGSDIQANFSSSAPWSFNTSGTAYRGYYDFVTVVLHELGHGLGFLSNTYLTSTGLGTIEQPTPFDAFTQVDATGTKLADLNTGSTELANALVSGLTWTGAKGIAANNGVAPKIYSPARYEAGSSTSHLDETLFNTSTSPLMTPVLDAAEVIYDPGPLTLAMFADMLGETPAPKVTAAPGAPKNVSAITGEGSAIVNFDPPVNNRNSQVESYVVEVVGGAIPPVTAQSSPVVVNGLKPGTSYVFTVKAQNSIGASPVAYSNSVLVSRTWKINVIDANATGSNVSTTNWRGSTVIAYTDATSGDLKMATWTGKKWNITTVDGNSSSNGRTENNVSGEVSLCVSGTGTKQVLHFFYADLIDQDLRHAAYDGKKFTFEIVDGNASSAQKVEDPVRVRTSDNVSVSNACAVTKEGLQVFYRNESLGILLGAVKRTNTWAYELIDGDRDSDGRTTGDVGFHLQALTVGQTVYLAYDSYFQFDAQYQPMIGDVRYAVRTGAKANSWNYFFLQEHSFSYPVAGYDVAIGLSGKKIYAAWLAATPSNTAVPSADTLRIAELTSSGVVSTRAVLPNGFGNPQAPLAISGSTVSYGCQERLCSASAVDGMRALLTGQKVDKKSTSTWIRITQGKTTKSGVLLSVNGKLTFVAN